MCWLIRPALESDVSEMLEIINDEARRGNVLPRFNIDYQNHVLVYDDITGKIVGCVGYKVWDQILPELISLVIVPGYRNKNISIPLVHALLDAVRRREFQTIFLLTEEPRFFSKFGFWSVSITTFPSKVFADCANCPKNTGKGIIPSCPDTAMLLKL